MFNLNFFSNPMEEKISLDNLEWFFFINDLAFLNEFKILDNGNPIDSNGKRAVIENILNLPPIFGSWSKHKILFFFSYFFM